MNSDHQNENVNGDAADTQPALRASELSYRRLFEAARDGVLILDVDTGRSNELNPFLFSCWSLPATYHQRATRT